MYVDCWMFLLHEYKASIKKSDGTIKEKTHIS